MTGIKKFGLEKNISCQHLDFVYILLQKTKLHE